MAAYQIGIDGHCTTPAISWTIQADTLAHAQTLCQSLATLLGRTLRLAGGSLTVGAAGNQYTPGAQGTTVPSPTGISF